MQRNRISLQGAGWSMSEILMTWCFK